MKAAVTLSTPEVSVGDPIEVRVTLDCAPASRIVFTNPAPSGTLERLGVTPWSFQNAGGRWRVERRERWASFAPDTTAKLRYVVASSEGSAELVSPAIHTVSVLPAGGGHPAPSPLAAPLAKTYIPWEWVAASALALLVALLFARLLRRRHISRYSPKSPDELFDQELSLLEEKLSGGEPDGEFFDWLAETTRWYLEQKLRIPAPRETSWEISRELERQTVPMPSREIEVVFAACDGFRFARRETRREQAAEALAAARRAGSEIRLALEPREMPA